MGLSMLVRILSVCLHLRVYSAAYVGLSEAETQTEIVFMLVHHIMLNLSEKSFGALGYRLEFSHRHGKTCRCWSLLMNHTCAGTF